MKPLYIKVPKKSEASFEVKDYRNVYFHNPIHFHEALELTLILKGKGTRFVGDHIDNFAEGDLVLIGSNLPHQWRSDLPHNTMESSKNVRAIVVHFNENCFGDSFFKTPELLKISKLLTNARRGLKVEGETHPEVSHLMHLLLKSKGFQRVSILLNLLDILAESEYLCPLASVSYEIRNKSSAPRIMDEIYEFIFENITNTITLTEISARFNMSRSSFCRYFKTHTQKTFTRFVLEARISVACRMLHENKLNISQIAFDCGFNNLSFFNREFKKTKGVTPLHYRKIAQAKNG